MGLYRISESVRTYVYAILNSQASARSCIIGNGASALTAQKAFLNDFENVVNCRVDIQEDIKSYQDTNSVGEGIYILPSNMNLNIKAGTAGYNNEIFGRLPPPQILLAFLKRHLLTLSDPEERQTTSEAPARRCSVYHKPITFGCKQFFIRIYQPNHEKFWRNTKTTGLAF